MRNAHSQTFLRELSGEIIEFETWINSGLFLVQWRRYKKTAIYLYEFSLTKHAHIFRRVNKTLSIPHRSWADERVVVAWQDKHGYIRKISECCKRRRDDVVLHFVVIE